MEPFLGEVKLLPYNFAPRGYAFCAGQQMAISQNQALFALIGTTYGGNGTTTFALPDLRSRVLNSQGTGAGGQTYVQGQQAGSEQVSLNVTQLPSHNHVWSGTADAANSAPPTNNALGGGRLAGAPLALYAPPGTGAPVTLAAGTLSPTGGNQPHNNIQPYLALAYCIALQGIFPSRN